MVPMKSNLMNVRLFFIRIINDTAIKLHDDLLTTTLKYVALGSFDLDAF